jgi:hypothetical protein
MTLPRTVADVLARHVSFEVESIDRMYCNVYQPRLQYPGGAAAFFVGHRGFTGVSQFSGGRSVAGVTRGLTWR